ncbi:MAG: helix-turn-helix domain-containing protein [Janthinobacterium lividum]
MARKEQEEAPEGELNRHPYLVQLGINISRVRKALGLTQEGVKKRAQTTGLNLFLIETGLREARILTLKTLADALETTPQALLPKEGDADIEALDFRNPKTIHRALSKRLSMLAVEIEEMREILKELEAKGEP